MGEHYHLITNKLKMWFICTRVAVYSIALGAWKDQVTRSVDNCKRITRTELNLHDPDSGFHSSLTEDESLEHCQNVSSGKNAHLQWIWVQQFPY